MKTFLFIGIFILFSFQLKAQTNYDSLIVGSWKEVGIKQLSSNIFYPTDVKYSTSTYTFFANSIYQEFGSVTYFFGDSLKESYVENSANNDIWAIRNHKLMVKEYSLGKRIYLSKDTLILEVNYKREGGKFFVYYKKEKQQLKFYTPFDIVLMNKESPSYKAFQRWKQKNDSIKILEIEDAIKHPSFRNDTTFNKKYLPSRIQQISYNKIITRNCVIESFGADSVKYFSYQGSFISRYEFIEYTNSPNSYTEKFRLIQLFKDSKVASNEIHRYGLIKNTNGFDDLIDTTIFINEFGEKTSNRISINSETKSDTTFYYIQNKNGNRYCQLIDIYSDYKTKGGFISWQVYQLHKRIGLLYNGDKEIEMIMNQKDKILETRIFYKNGIKLPEPEIIHGDGKYTFCNPDGQVCCECEIKNGKIKNCHPIK
ncbi:MAG: hypothetical protein RJA07_878 [Bacteroidota bacterium]|jgi:hypothetical protein